MKSNPEAKLLTLISIGIIFAFSPILSQHFILISGVNEKNNTEYNDMVSIDKDDLKNSIVSVKIHIDNNWTDVKSAGICTGNGTYSEPYIIEDLVIDGGGTGSCILIENSSVYFRIENCTIFNSGGYPNAGIRLSYVNNSHLFNNTCSSNYYGISLYYS